MLKHFLQIVSSGVSEGREWIYMKRLRNKMFAVCFGCSCLGLTNDYKKQINSGENWLVCKHDWKMELFIISIQYKIKYRNTLRDKGQLRQLCDKNQIKTVAIKSSVRASESIKLALNWKRWLRGKQQFHHSSTDVYKLK